MHGQIVSLLTSSALTAMFERNPGYDARRLLGKPACWHMHSRLLLLLAACHLTRRVACTPMTGLHAR